MVQGCVEEKRCLREEEMEARFCGVGFVAGQRPFRVSCVPPVDCFALLAFRISCCCHPVRDCEDARSVQGRRFLDFR